MRPSLFLFALLSTASCATSPAKTACPEEQARIAAVKTICFIDQQVAFTDDEDPLERSRKRSAWLDTVQNPEAIYLKTLLSVKPSSEQSQSLRERAREASLAACPLADEIEREELSALSP